MLNGLYSFKEFMKCICYDVGPGFSLSSCSRWYPYRLILASLFVRCCEVQADDLGLRIHLLGTNQQSEMSKARAKQQLSFHTANKTRHCFCMYKTARVVEALIAWPM